MDSFDFRKIMIEKIRAFEHWAWKDCTENPSDYVDMTFERWTDLFKEYNEND